MYYFVGILNRVGDIFLSSCRQVFSILNVTFKSISKPHKSSVKKKKKSSYKQYRYNR